MLQYAMAAEDCAQAVELGDDAHLQGIAPTAATADGLQSSSPLAADQRTSLEDATLE